MPGNYGKGRGYAHAGYGGEDGNSGGNGGRKNKPFRLCENFHNGKCKFDGWKWLTANMPVHCKCGAAFCGPDGKPLGKKGKGGGQPSKGKSKDEAEVAFWEAAQKTSALLPLFKKEYPNSDFLKPSEEESPVFSVGRLAKEIKDLEAEVKEAVSKSASHAKLIEDHTVFKAKCDERAAKAQVELWDKREELDKATVVAPRDPYKLPKIQVDPETEKKLQVSPELSEKKTYLDQQQAEIETLITQHAARVKAFFHESDKVEAEVQEPSPPVEEPPNLATASEETMDDMAIDNNEKTLEQKAEEAETERKTRITELEKRAAEDLAVNAAAFKKARTEEAEAKKLAESTQGG